MHERLDTGRQYTWRGWKDGPVMPTTRLGAEEQREVALDDLVHLGSQLDELSIVADGTDRVNLHPRNGDGYSARVLAYDSVSEAGARHLVATGARGPTIVVANRITEPARHVLVSQGWGWLDRRIGAHIPLDRRDIVVRYVGDGATDVSGASDLVRVSRPAADGPIRGRAGIAYAAALLCNPNRPPSFRSVAEAVNMSPTAISNAVKQLAVAGLVGHDYQPTLPELFWALAEVWGPLKVVAIATPPDPAAPAFTSRVDRLKQPGWVLGGDLAAVELGAPIFSTESRPWLWVPTQVELRRAERTYGSAKWSDRAAAIAAPPTSLVCQRRRAARPGGQPWPLPHPVFVALDLARDPGRGRELLSRWEPEGIDHVWR